MREQRCSGKPAVSSVLGFRGMYETAISVLSFPYAAHSTIVTPPNVSMGSGAGGGAEGYGCGFVHKHVSFVRRQ